MIFEFRKKIAKFARSKISKSEKRNRPVPIDFNLLSLKCVICNM